MKNKTTKIISLRVPAEVFDRVNEKAKQAQKPRADFVKDVFMPAFERLVKKQNKAAEQV